MPGQLLPSKLVCYQIAVTVVKFANPQAGAKPEKADDEVAKKKKKPKTAENTDRCAQTSLLLAFSGLKYVRKLTLDGRRKHNVWRQSISNQSKTLV